MKSCDQRMQMRRPHMAHMDMDMDMDMEHMDMDMDMDMDTEMEPEGRWCCVRDTLCLWPLPGHFRLWELVRRSVVNHRCNSVCGRAVCAVRRWNRGVSYCYCHYSPPSRAHHTTHTHTPSAQHHRHDAHLTGTFTPSDPVRSTNPRHREFHP